MDLLLISNKNKLHYVYIKDFNRFMCSETKLIGVSVIFHNLRGYDSHLIMQEINKFDVKLNVIPNGLETCMAFTTNNNFIDSMQFMNSSLNKLVKNLSDNDFKYLSQEFSGDLLQLVKQKGLYPDEYMESFEKFSEDELSDNLNFLVL